MVQGIGFGAAAVVLLTVAPVAVSGCALCFHSDCGPPSVIVYLTPETDGRASDARICFDGTCATVPRTDVSDARYFEQPLPALDAVADADDVVLTVTLLDASGAELGSTDDDIDIDAGQCDCPGVEFTWDGTEFDRFI